MTKFFFILDMYVFEKWGLLLGEERGYKTPSLTMAPVVAFVSVAAETCCLQAVAQQRLPV
jgi:hypothetical protein